MNDIKSDNLADAAQQSRLEKFLVAVESRTTNAVHRRLIAACRSSEPAVALEAELSRIVAEILDET